MGLARFILSPSLRRCSLPTPHSGEDQRKSVVHRSPIHSDPPSGVGVRGERPAPPRAATPEGAARPPPRTPGGSVSPAAAAQSLLAMAHRTGSPPPPRPPRNRKLPSEPDFRNTRQQNSAAGVGGERRGSERVRGACSALWRREAGGASQPLISTWRGGRCHPLLQVRLTLESDVPKDRQPGRVASDANPYVLEL